MASEVPVGRTTSFRGGGEDVHPPRLHPTIHASRGPFWASWATGASEGWTFGRDSLPAPCELDKLPPKNADAERRRIRSSDVCNVTRHSWEQPHSSRSAAVQLPRRFCAPATLFKIGLARTPVPCRLICSFFAALNGGSVAVGQAPELGRRFSQAAMGAWSSDLMALGFDGGEEEKRWRCGCRSKGEKETSMDKKQFW